MSLPKAITDTIEGIRAARELHAHAKYFADNIPPEQERRSVMLRVTGPKTVKLGADAVFYGTAVLPVKITSDGENVRTVAPINGKFITILFFTKNAGLYHVTFTSGIEKKTLSVEVTE